MRLSSHQQVEAPPCRCHQPIGWRIQHSLWMLPAIVGLGMVTWASFGYLAARVRRTSYLLLTLWFFIGAVIGIIWTSIEPAGQAVSGGFVFLLWAGGILAAVIVNPTYHRWLWREGGKCLCDGQGRGFAARPAHASSQAASPDGSQSSRMFVIQDAPYYDRMGQHHRSPETHHSTSHAGASTTPTATEPRTAAPTPRTESVDPTSNTSVETQEARPASSPLATESQVTDSAAESSPSLGLAVVRSPVYAQQRKRCVLSWTTRLCVTHLMPCPLSRKRAS